MNNTPYTQQEIDYVKENYGKILVSEIAKKLGKDKILVSENLSGQNERFK
jgi:hypothetical protein